MLLPAGIGLVADRAGMRPAMSLLVVSRLLIVGAVWMAGSTPGRPKAIGPP